MRALCASIAVQWDCECGLVLASAGCTSAQERANCHAKQAPSRAVRLSASREVAGGWCTHRFSRTAWSNCIASLTNFCFYTLIAFFVCVAQTSTNYSIISSLNKRWHMSPCCLTINCRHNEWISFQHTLKYRKLQNVSFPSGWPNEWLWIKARNCWHCVV